MVSLGAAVLLAAVLSLGAGCRHAPPPANPQPFVFGADTFAYANELVWDYRFDQEDGTYTHEPREPKPDYTHHCFVVAKMARQFFEHARFNPAQPKADSDHYEALIRRVITRDPMFPLATEDKVVIPGYPNLHAFSKDYEELLKEHGGGAWRSYFQRGHWRMLLPFSRSHQANACRQWQRAIQANHPPVVHVLQFPELKINHAIVLFAFEDRGDMVVFQAYDPNDPDQPHPLTFRESDRTFYWPRSNYFIGGAVDAYEVYRSWIY